MLNGSQQNLLPPSGNISASNGPAASGASAAQSTSGNAAPTPMSRFDSLEQTLEMFVENARHLCVIVSDFPGSSGGGGGGSASASGSGNSSSGGSSQAVLNQKLQTLVSGLQELDHGKHQFQDVKIPLELFDQFVDTARNPQLYTKECMERTLNKNKQMNGKTELYKKFRAHLLKELSEEFPKEAMQYRAIREQTGNAASATSYSSNGPVVKQDDPR